MLWGGIQGQVTKFMEAADYKQKGKEKTEKKKGEKADDEAVRWLT
jgi:hypothetical protein